MKTKFKYEFTVTVDEKKLRATYPNFDINYSTVQEFVDTLSDIDNNLKAYGVTIKTTKVKKQKYGYTADINAGNYFDVELQKKID